jgi:hypothetical protein
MEWVGNRTEVRFEGGAQVNVQLRVLKKQILEFDL